jgi:dihydroxyacetone kinase
LVEWSAAIEHGSRAISELGGAKPGDRTMLDALDRFVQALKNGSGLDAAATAAEEGARATAQMKPKAGRSSYLGERVLGTPDPGAKAVSIWLRAVEEALKGNDPSRIA